jgi:hypothetical protein
VFSLLGVAENGLREQTHEAEKWQRASAMLLLRTHRKAMSLVYAKTWFYIFELCLEEFFLRVSLALSFFCLENFSFA